MSFVILRHEGSAEFTNAEGSRQGAVDKPLSRSEVPHGKAESHDRTIQAGQKAPVDPILRNEAMVTANDHARRSMTTPFPVNQNRRWCDFATSRKS